MAQTHSISHHVPASAGRASGLSGSVRVPGDKSISHRALLFALLAKGRTRITGLLEGDDVLATAAAVRQLGATVEKQPDGVWQVDGVGLGHLRAPAQTLDMGNSGTAARLLIGLLATHPLTAHLTGDASLRSRPMARVTGPLAPTGATFETQAGGRLPMRIDGCSDGQPLHHRLTVASAQVKSALLLAALNVVGESTVIDPYGTRDHTENMLSHFGADISVAREGALSVIKVQGRPKLVPADLAVPADPSSAAFPVVAALICEGSHITLPGVCLNPSRTGLFSALEQMGANISIDNQRVEGGEQVGDLVAQTSQLKGITVVPETVPSMVDEFPILAVAAANASGLSRFCGLAELRVKESDRLAAIHAGLLRIGVKSHIEGDDLIIEGAGHGGVPGGAASAPVVTHFDHRIAMSFLIAGLASQQPIRVDDTRAIATSFPNFSALLTELGASLLR